MNRTSLALALACLVCSVLSVATQQPEPKPAAFDPQRTYPVETLKADLKVLWDVLEEGHGGFDRYTPAGALRKSFDSAAAGMTAPLTEFDFYVRLLPLIAEIKDGHTLLLLSPGATATLDARPIFFPFALRFLKDRAYILRNLSADASIRDGAELLAVDGTAAGDIVESLLPFVPSDAGIRTGRIRRLEAPSTFGRLFALRSGIRESYRIRVRPTGGGEVREVTVPGVTAGDLSRLLRERYPDRPIPRSTVPAFLLYLLGPFITSDLYLHG